LWETNRPQLRRFADQGGQREGAQSSHQELCTVPPGLFAVGAGQDDPSPEGRIAQAREGNQLAEEVELDVGGAQTVEAPVMLRHGEGVTTGLVQSALSPGGTVSKWVHSSTASAVGARGWPPGRVA